MCRGTVGAVFNNFQEPGMSFFSSLLTACLVLVGTSAAYAQTPPAAPVSSDLAGADGVKIGTATLTELPKGVLLRVQLRGLPPGWHGMHFHEKGDCGDAKFMNAGGHVHGEAALVHGLANANATDAGDLPNLYVSGDGAVTVELYSTLVSFKGAGGRPALFDADGSSLVIHVNPDDYTTQPIGGAGARIACAVIK
jgi:Cu-Zn family superoxide dismutase